MSVNVSGYVFDLESFLQPKVDRVETFNIGKNSFTVEVCYDELVRVGDTYAEGSHVRVIIDKNIKDEKSFFHTWTFLVHPDSSGSCWEFHSDQEYASYFDGKIESDQVRSNLETLKSQLFS